MVVRAAGGVVWRRAPGRTEAGPTGANRSEANRTEVVLVHRPAYDDWTFPKGKVKGAESDQEAAAREVEEETGLVCSLGAELPRTTYTDGQGRPKEVRYWEMTAQPSLARPSPRSPREVDEARWVGTEQARLCLSYPGDLAVLDGFLERRQAR